MKIHQIPHIPNIFEGLHFSHDCYIMYLFFFSLLDQSLKDKSLNSMDGSNFRGRTFCHLVDFASFRGKCEILGKLYGYCI